MLHLKTVHQETFAMLQDLASQENLRGFSLAGGTGLALLLGHRISVDLDFFTNSKFDSRELFETLRDVYDVSNCSQSSNSLSLSVKFQSETIKVDFLRHNYPLVQPVQVLDGVTIFSMADIAAMKLNAIANRGAKKDFYDIHALLDYFSIQDLFEFFERKYQQLNSFTVVKSLVYFADADLQPEPISLQNVNWRDVKENLRNQLRNL